MLKVFKWLWDRAQDYGEQKVISMIHSLAEYHRLKSETAHLKEKYEPESENDEPRKFERRHSAQEHSIIANALYEILTSYHRQRENEASNDGR